MKVVLAVLVILIALTISVSAHMPRDHDGSWSDPGIRRGHGDHGQGRPWNGSLHANYHAAGGEVDPELR